MKNFKSALRLSLLFLLPFQAFSGEGGDGARNGGDPRDLVLYESCMNVARAMLTAGGKGMEKQLGATAADFYAACGRINFMVVDKTLKDRNGNVRCAVNFREQTKSDKLIELLKRERQRAKNEGRIYDENRLEAVFHDSYIQFNSRCFDELRADTKRFYPMLTHEILGVLGIERTVEGIGSVYQGSKAISNQLGTIPDAVKVANEDGKVAVKELCLRMTKNVTIDDFQTRCLKVASSAEYFDVAAVRLGAPQAGYALYSLLERIQDFTFSRETILECSNDLKMKPWDDGLAPADRLAAYEDCLLASGVHIRQLKF